jgi:hypothetical protein
MFLLEHLDDEGIQDIRVVEVETGLKYEAKLYDFQKHGVPVMICNDPHLCLPLSCWNITNSSEFVAFGGEES